MLLFFGTRSTKIQYQHITGNTECPYCNSQNSFLSATFGTYFHLFWIPMFTLGRTTVVECTHCKKTFKEKELPVKMQQVLAQNKPLKSTLWHCSGCFIIMAVVGLLFLFVLYGVFF